MVEITESDIETNTEYTDLGYSTHFVKIETESLKQADKIKQQILQNQKDAQEYRKVEKILINHCGETGQNEGLVETLERIQSQHKKLVDAIQKIVEQEDYFCTDCGSTCQKKLQNLLKEIEKE